MTCTLLDVLTQKIVVSLAVILYLYIFGLFFMQQKISGTSYHALDLTFVSAFFMYHPGVTTYMQGNQDKKRLSYLCKVL